jgi:hypothetical protein
LSPSILETRRALFSGRRLRRVGLDGEPRILRGMLILSSHLRVVGYPPRFGLGRRGAPPCIPIVGFAVAAFVFCFWAAGRSPDVSPGSVARRLRLEFAEASDRAKAQHDDRRKIVREDADRRRLINELEQTAVHSGYGLLSYPRTLARWPGVSRADRGALPGTAPINNYRS